MKYLSLIILIILTTGYTQTPIANYTVKWVNSEDGLKQLSVRFCIPDNNGFVWIGTELGLYRYDGSNLLEIKEKRYPSLSKQRITRMGKDNITGKIYLETDPDNYQYVIENNKIERINPTNYSENAIFTFNNFCYTSSNSLINKIYKNTLIKSLLKEYTSVTFLTASLTSNYLYLPQYKYLIAFDKNGLLINLGLNCTSGIVLMQFGEATFAIDKGKITLISEGKIIPKSIKTDGIVQSYLNRNFTNLSDIEIFASKNNYYLKYKGGIFKIIYNNDTLSTKFLFSAPAEDITSISYLENENLYFIGTQTKGMAILKPNLFNSILLEEKNSNKSINYCYSVAAISNKEWYSASGWNFNVETSKAKVNDFLIDFSNIRFVLPYKNKYYFQAKNNLWNIENHKNDYDFNYPKNLRENIAGFSGYTYHKGQLYLSYPDGLFFLKGSKLMSDQSINKKLKGKIINGICSINNDLILPTTKGVYSYTPATKKIAVIKGLENVNARYIKPINKFNFWVGCYGEGLFLVNQNKVHKVVDKNIDITTAHAIEEDVHGDLWISTNDGLLKTKKQLALKKILANQPINCYKYSTEDGLLTNEFNGSGTHPSLQTKEGIIGFPSMKGFVWFSSNTVPKHFFNGSIFMDKVVVDNKTIIPLLNNSYLIPKATGVVSFNFGYGYYFNRENLSVSYRFEDQKNWTEIKGNTFQISRYKNGKHKLIIKISTHGFEDKSAVFQSFTLDFETRYYETYWFWGIAVLLFFGVIYASYLLGLFLNKKRETILKLKIDEKTAQLQESVLELESSKDAINKTLLEKNILLSEIHHRVKNNLQLVMSLLNIQAQDKELITIEEFLEKGQSRIASMVLIHENLYQRENVGSVDFQEYLSSLTENVRTSFGDAHANITITINVSNIYFDIQTAIPLGLIINELITNAFKHAFPNQEAGSISVSINQKSDKHYVLIIEDNGVGFVTTQNKKKSLGLELVSLLVLQLKGTLSLDQSKGTSYIINFQTL